MARCRSLRATNSIDPDGDAPVKGLQFYHRNRVSVALADLALDASGMDGVPGIDSGVRVQFRGGT